MNYALKYVKMLCFHGLVGKRIVSRFIQYISSVFLLALAVNCMYWEKRFPRLLTTKQLQDLKREGCPLVGVSDVTCDIGGSMEFINQTTTIDQPFLRLSYIGTFVYFNEASMYPSKRTLSLYEET